MAIIPKLDLDNTPETKEHGTIVFGKNMVLDNKVFKNENGCTVHNTSKYKIIGIISLPIGEVRLSTNNIYSEIAIVTEDTVRVVLETQYLGFNQDCPIEGVFKYNNKGELIIAWWSGVGYNSQKPGCLNLDSLPFGLTGLELTNPDEIVKAFLFPEYEFPIIDVQAVTDGGSLRQAKYSFVVQYEIDEVNHTNYTMPTRDVFVADIISDPDLAAYPNLGLHAGNFGEYTNKCISLVVRNLDDRYKSFRLGVIRKEGLNCTFEIAGRYNIPASGIVTIIYSGETIDTSVTLNDLVDRVVVDRIHAGTVNNRRLVNGHLKTKEALDYQKYANNIKLTWTTDGYNTINQEGGYLNENGKVVFYHRGFTPDEVMAFYFHWVFKDGTISEGFHIPGRLVDGVWKAPFYTPGNKYEWEINANAKVFHFRDSAIISGVDGNGHPYGEFGYWENESEFYPDDHANFDIWGWDAGSSSYRNLTELDPLTYPSLANTNVRHHKLPDPYVINVGSNHEYTKPVAIDPASTDPIPANLNVKRIIGISIENISVPDEIRPLVQGFTISFAKRDLANQTIFAVSDIQTQDWITVPPRTGSNYRMHDFALISQKPYLDASYIKAYYLVNNDETICGHPIALEGHSCARVGSCKYIPSDNQAALPSNEYREQYIHLDCTETVPIPFANEMPFFDPLLLQYNFDTSNLQTLWVGAICAFRLNVFNPFYDQELVPTGYFFPISLLVAPTTKIDSITLSDGTLKRIHGGDTFLSKELVDNVYGWVDTPPTVNVFRWHNQYISHYTPINYQYRRRPDAGFLYLTSGGYEFTDYDYDITWIKFVTIVGLGVYNPYVYRTNLFPYRIIRSIPDQLEGAEETWRIFLSSSYHECAKSKGVIWKLDSVNKSLIIRCQYATYIAKSKDEIDTTTGGLNVLPGDIFDREPDELIPTDGGYIGCSSKFCGFVFEGGYFIVDAKQGTCFILGNDGSLERLHILGVEKFFRENLHTTVDLDNPYALMGLTATFDMEWNRIILSKRDCIIDNFKGQYSGIITDYVIGDVFLYNGILWTISAEDRMQVYAGAVIDTSFTISFNLKANGWGTFHDYTPHYLFNNRNGVFAVHDNKVFKHNVKTIKGVYYDVATYPSFIDIIFNAPEGIAKYLEFITFATDLVSDMVYQYDRSITQVMIYTKNQCSELTNIQTNTQWFNVLNGKDVHGNWFFSEFKDCVVNDKVRFLTPILPTTGAMQPTANVDSQLKDWFNCSSFIGKYFVVRLQFDNVSAPTGATTVPDVWINNADISIQKSTI